MYIYSYDYLYFSSISYDFLLACNEHNSKSNSKPVNECNDFTLLLYPSVIVQNNHHVFVSQADMYEIWYTWLLLSYHSVFDSDFFS